MHHHNRSSCKNNDDNTNSFHHSAPESIDNTDRTNATAVAIDPWRISANDNLQNLFQLVQIHWLSFLTPTYAPLRTQRTCPLVLKHAPLFFDSWFPLRTYWQELLLKLYKQDQSTKYARYCIFFDTWHKLWHPSVQTLPNRPLDPFWHHSIASLTPDCFLSTSYLISFIWHLLQDTCKNC